MRNFYCLGIGALLVAIMVAIGGRVNEPIEVGNLKSACRVGGKPSLDLPRGLPGSGRMLTQPLIAGCGRVHGEDLQIIAFDTTKGFCSALDRLSRKSETGGACKSNGESWRQYCPELCLSTILPAGSPRAKRMHKTIVVGAAGARTESVLVENRHGLRKRAIPAVVATVGPALSTRLHQGGEPFVLYGAVLPECIQPQDIEVTAFDIEGAAIGSVRGNREVPDYC